MIGPRFTSEKNLLVISIKENGFEVRVEDLTKLVNFAIESNSFLEAVQQSLHRQRVDSDRISDHFCSIPGELVRSTPFWPVTSTK